MGLSTIPEQASHIASSTSVPLISGYPSRPHIASFTHAFHLRISVQTAHYVSPPPHLFFLLRISVHTAQHTSHLIHSCLSSPCTRSPHTAYRIIHTGAFISRYPFTLHNTHHISFTHAFLLRIPVHPTLRLASSTPDPRNCPPLNSYHHFEHFHTLFCQKQGKPFYIE